MGYNGTLGLAHGAHCEPHGHSQPQSYSHKHTAQPGLYCKNVDLCPIHDPSPDLELWVAEPTMLWNGRLEGQGLVEELQLVGGQQPMLPHPVPPLPWPGPHPSPSTAMSVMGFLAAEW